MNRRDVLTGSLSMATASIGGGSANANQPGCIDGVPEAALFSTEPVTQFPVAPMDPEKWKDAKFFAARFRIVEGPRIVVFEKDFRPRSDFSIMNAIKRAPEGFKHEVYSRIYYKVDQFQIFNSSNLVEYNVTDLYTDLLAFRSGLNGPFYHRLRDSRLYETRGVRYAYVWAHPDTYRDGVLKDQSMRIVPFAINTTKCSEDNR